MFNILIPNALDYLALDVVKSKLKTDKSTCDTL